MKFKQVTSLVLLLCGMIIGCKKETKTEVSLDQWKKEILDTEHAFAAMAKTKGIPEAFLIFAADSAVLMRNNNLIIGKEKLSEYFASQ